MIPRDSGTRLPGARTVASVAKREPAESLKNTSALDLFVSDGGAAKRRTPSLPTPTSVRGGGAESGLQDGADWY
jgi:hypothetical protein